MVQGVHSKHSFLSLDGEDISTYVSSFSIDDTNDEAETTGFGDDSKKYAQGYRDISASMSGAWGDADGQGIHGQLSDLRDEGDVVPLIYGPAGAEAGNVQLTYDAQVMAFSPESDIGGAVRYSATLRLSNPGTGSFS